MDLGLIPKGGLRCPNPILARSSLKAMVGYVILNGSLMESPILNSHLPKQNLKCTIFLQVQSDLVKPVLLPP